MVGYRYAYHGKAAHAAVVPHEGINALNAVIHLFTGIDALRQHLREDVRIHGIITDGGRAANVVPDSPLPISCYVRETGITCTRSWKKSGGWPEGLRCSPARAGDSPSSPNVENVRPNVVLVRAARANAEAVGMPIDATPSGWNGGGASTDFGNVSQVLPAYYLRFAVSKEPVPGHSTAMTQAAKSALAHDAPSPPPKCWP